MMRRILWVPMLAAVVLSGRADFAHPGPQMGRPECPHDWDFKSGAVPDFEPIINVPEFNDCERFIVSRHDSLAYDSLYAIFASPRLNQLDSDVVKGQGRGGQLDSDGEQQPADSGVLAAFVYAEGRYPPLGIMPGFDCLYLWQTRGKGLWQAAMLPIKATSYSPRDCPRRVNAEDLARLGTVLEVRPDANSTGAPTSAFPAVARWDWDSVHTRQYIGIKCGAAWCGIGERGFAPSRLAWPTADAISAATAAGMNTATAGTNKRWRTRVIKGWYDQQILAALDSRGKPYPSRIRGTIYPDPLLDDHDTVTDFPLGGWVPVAHVALDVPTGVLNPYKLSLNLDPTPPGAGATLNTMELCRGSRDQCWSAAILAPYSAAERASIARHLDSCHGEGTWWVRVHAAGGGPPAARCAVRRGTESMRMHIPGTVRWRWLASDETVWNQCGQGCCESEVCMPGSGSC